MANSPVFRKVGAARPGRSLFNLSYEKKFDFDMGQLIPVLMDEAVPGDIWKIANEIVIRFKPLVAPVLHEINCFVHYFFVPTRIIDPNFTKFMTGFQNTDSGGAAQSPSGASGGNVPYTGQLPRYNYTAYSGGTGTLSSLKGTLHDFFGMPLLDLGYPLVTSVNCPISYPWYAYNMIYNEYYRDQNVGDQVLNGAPWDTLRSWWNNSVAFRNWEKDYFTSALPWQQKGGVAPSLPISIASTGLIDWRNLYTSTNPDLSQTVNSAFTFIKDSAGYTYAGSNAIVLDPALVPSNKAVDSRRNQQTTALNDWLLNNRNVNISNSAMTFNVSDMRRLFAVEKWLERNARGGTRYNEWLLAHYSVSPRDERLQRPEYIGGTRQPVIFSEVLQTSGTQPATSTNPTPTVRTAQGNMAGHGISVNRKYAARYKVKEFGYIVGLMSVMPRLEYIPTGYNRQWLRYSRYDFFDPLFVNLSEQAIKRVELYYATGEALNNSIFGYQGIYDELRTKQSFVCNNFRDIYDYWHLARRLAPNVQLNSDFVSSGKPGAASTADAHYTIRKDIFAYHDEPGLVCQFGNLLHVVRPLPFQATPGLVDHH